MLLLRQKLKSMPRNKGSNNELANAKPDTTRKFSARFNIDQLNSDYNKKGDDTVVSFFVVIASVS